MKVRAYLTLLLSITLITAACITHNEQAAETSQFEKPVLTEVSEVQTTAPIKKTTTAPSITPEPTVTPTLTPTPTATPTPTPTPTPSGLIGGKYDVFEYGEQPVQTETVYKSDQVSITVSVFNEHPYEQQKLVYFVADIYIQDISSLRTAAPYGFGKKGFERITEIAKRNNAILAVNGDYPDYSKDIFVLRNGELFQQRTFHSRDVLFLYMDGSIEVFDGKSFQPKSVDLDRVWQGWQFGPYLIDEEGNPRTKFPAYDITGLNPRTVFGYYEPGHYCFVVVDGRNRKYSVGLSMQELAQLMVDLGCTQAYNMDGGASTQMYWNGDIYNHPSENRPLSDIIYICEPIGDGLLFNDSQ